LEEIRVPIGPVGGGLAQAYLSRQAVVWEGRGPVPENLRLKPPYDQVAALRSQAFVILPLTIQGRAIGVIAVDRKNSRRPLEADALELLQLFAAQAALTVEHGQLYEAQRMAAIQLEARVEDRTRDLQEAMLLLEAGSKHKSEFLANMSHELRTPLNSILGFSDLLRDQKVGPLTEKQARYVYNIRESGRHLLTLINDLLDLSKVEAGKLELRPEVFNLREAIETALTGIRPQSLAKALELTLQVDEALSLLTADPVRFKQILLNLLSNAIKFTAKGGSITVTARPVHSPERTGPGTADPGREPAGEFVEIAVADTGVGIRPEDLPKLFQPFTQLEGSFTKQYHGTGLGLALTKRLVESHGGTVRAESEGEGRGSTFTVRLPLTSQA
jgi:signal transduction histidine kinase